MTALTELELIASGKVREMYRLGPEADGRLLMVASDRISTYDAVHPTEIPDKGKVLTGLSAFWFERTRGIVANHLVSRREGVPEGARGRALVVRELEMLPVECVVRGYLTGSAWKDYLGSGSVSGIALRPGLRESERLPEPIFTPRRSTSRGRPTW
jgi:phosphoribosylaminoimidazole-succinocarboxamide synthase